MITFKLVVEFLDGSKKIVEERAGTLVDALTKANNSYDNVSRVYQTSYIGA